MSGSKPNLSGIELQRYAIERQAAFREILDREVVGMEAAKRVGARIMYMIDAHLNLDIPVQTSKLDVLMIGPTGVGKTLISKTIARNSQVPFVRYPLTRVSETGFKGSSVDDVFPQYIHAAAFCEAIERGVAGALKDPETLFEGSKLAKCGIILFDEFDKIVHHPRIESSATAKYKAQYELLDILEGTEIDIDYYGKEVTVDTHDITFICAGAFAGLEHRIAQRLGVDTESTPIEELYAACSTRDLESYGMDEQVAARFKRILYLPRPNRREMKEILLHDNSVLRGHQEALVGRYGTQLVVEPEAIDYLVDFAMKRIALGARALDVVCDGMMDPLIARLGHYTGEGSTELRVDLPLAKRLLGDV